MQTFDQWLYYIGYGLLVIAVLVSGFGVSGDRMRANYDSERQNDPDGTERRNRLKWTGWILLAAVAVLAAAILLDKLV